MPVLYQSLIVAAILAQDTSPKPPTPMPEPPPKTSESPDAQSSDAVNEAERARIESMLQKYASSKLKGLALKEQFRRRLIQPEGPDGEPIEEPENEGPHELGFQAQIPDSDDAVALTVESAEAIGVRRYRLTLGIAIPFKDIGGYYRFSGIGLAIGWRINSVNADVEILATLDVGWKNLDNGNIGIFPGGFIDPNVPEEERNTAHLIENLRINVRNMDLSQINVDGINGLRTFYRNGEPVGGGRLLRFIDGAAQQLQLETLIAGGLNQAIRSNEPALLDGINAALQAELPETQIQVTSFIEKLAIQANLPGKKPEPRIQKRIKPPEEVPVPVEKEI